MVTHRSAKPRRFLLLPAAHTMGIRLALGAASGGGNLLVAME